MTQNIKHEKKQIQKNPKFFRLKKLSIPFKLCIQCIMFVIINDGQIWKITNADKEFWVGNGLSLEIKITANRMNASMKNGAAVMVGHLILNHFTNISNSQRELAVFCFNTARRRKRKRIP